MIKFFDADRWAAWLEDLAEMFERLAGIDVHERMLAVVVVVVDVAVDGEYVFERRLIGTAPEQLRLLVALVRELKQRAPPAGSKEE